MRPGLEEGVKKGSSLLLTHFIDSAIKMGIIAWQAEYSPFGTVTINAAVVENNLRFPGQYYDSETGLHYNWHRYYDPTTGRYLTPDPIGLAGGINPFVYAENNSVNYTDPMGLDAGIISVPTAIGLGIAYGILHYGIPIAADIGQWIGNHLWNEKTESEDGTSCEDDNSLTWPETPEEMDELLDIEGKDIPDGPTTPGRNKKEWKPNKDTKIIYEEHPYHPEAPDWHKGPHWHLDTPGKRHKRYLPGTNIPGQ